MDLPEEKTEHSTSTSASASTSTSTSTSSEYADVGMEMAPPRSSYKHMLSAGPTRFMKVSSEDEGADVEFGLGDSD